MFVHVWNSVWSNRNVKFHFHFTCARPLFRVLQTQDFANKSCTWIEAAPKSWKIAHKPQRLYTTLRYYYPRPRQYQLSYFPRHIDLKLGLQPQPRSKCCRLRKYRPILTWPRVIMYTYIGVYVTTVVSVVDLCVIDIACFLWRESYFFRFRKSACNIANGRGQILHARSSPWLLGAVEGEGICEAQR